MDDKQTPSPLSIILLLGVAVFLVWLGIRHWRNNDLRTEISAELREAIKLERNERLRRFIQTDLPNQPGGAGTEINPRLVYLLLEHRRTFDRYPDGLDSLLAGAGISLRNASMIDNLHPGLQKRLKLDVLDQADVTALNRAGIRSVRVVDTLIDECDQQALILRKADGSMAPEDIFRPPVGDLSSGDRQGGCGSNGNTLLAPHGSIMIWRSHPEDMVQPSGRLIALGLGDDSTLVQADAPNEWPAMPYLPFSPRQPYLYGRYITLWEIPYQFGPAELRAVVRADGRNMHYLPRRQGIKADTAYSPEAKTERIPPY